MSDIKLSSHEIKGLGGIFCKFSPLKRIVSNKCQAHFITHVFFPGTLTNFLWCYCCLYNQWNSVTPLEELYPTGTRVRLCVCV